MVCHAAALLVLAAIAQAGDKPDDSAEPMPRPKIALQGKVEENAEHVHIAGKVLEVRSIQEEGRHEIDVEDVEKGKVTLTLDVPSTLPIDLAQGREVEVDLWSRMGFGGCARGARIKDADGVVLLVDDGGYGNAIHREDLAPFEVSQEDAGCRNRANQPGRLNNFWLLVRAGEASVKLIHGQSGDLAWKERTYRVVAIKSVARVGDVRWTDAPYEEVSFAIGRVPKE